MLFRLMRGSGVAGLRGMETMSRRDGVDHRPASARRRKERDLIAFAKARGAAFIDDPSNAELRFARPRLRALIARPRRGRSRRGGARPSGPPRGGGGRGAGPDRRPRSRRGSARTARIDARALFEAPIAIVQRILARRIAAAGGRDSSRIGLEKIEALALRLGAARRSARLRRNVGGAVVRLTAKGKLDFSPEPPRTSGKR